MEWKKCTVVSRPESQNIDNCNDFKYSVTISAGIGFIFLGNIYDNIEKPRKVTVLLLVILSVISLVEAIFSSEIESHETGSSAKTKVAMTLY